MRKLKTLLILMFAACLSFTLFACGGGDDDEVETGKALNLLSGEQIELTDADTQETFNTKMQTYKLVGRNDEGRVDIPGSDCDITGTINYGVIDRYTVTFKPRENNANGVTAEVVVVIDHAWGAPDASGKEVCAHDGATRITKDEDVAIHYGGFHYGTGNGPTGAEANAAEAIPQVLLTEEQASSLGLHAEKTTTNVFNTAAGINEGVTSSGRIKEFGRDERAGKVVPTLTAGDLAPGMSITIEGYAKTDAGTSNTTPGGPWNVVNGNWNAPSYGIADPYSPLCTTANGGINVGTAVIVRSEGWVLYNGIGQELNNTLGGLPKFVEGGSATESGSTDKSNCASWDRATADFLTGQDVTNRPAYTSSDWKNWWVYSEGQDRHSLDSYQSFIHVRVTWTYRTYGEGDDQIGIIVIDSDYLDEDTTFRSYIKVPAATRGAYRTIIHGDYSTLLITKSAYVETETVTNMQVAGLKADATKEYLAGEQIDAGAVFDMQVQSEQNSNWHDGGIAVTNDMLYYYKGTDYNQAKTDVEKAEDWEAVGDQLLTTDMKIFKIVLERADDTFHGIVPEEACNQIKIVANNVAGAVGDEYNTNLNSRDPMATYTRALGKSGDTYYVDLTINKALFRAIPSEANGTFTSAPGTDYRFAAIRLLGIDAFSVTGEQKKSGTVGSDTFYYTYQQEQDGDDVLLVIAIKKDMLGKALLIEDVQGADGTDIRLTFGTGSLGFDVSSSISATKPTLNAGGTVTVTYQNLPENSSFQVFAGGNSALGTVYARTLANASETAPVALGTSGIKVTGYTTNSTTTTVTFSFPAFDFANWTTMPYIRATASSAALAEDYVEYDLSFTESTANQSEGGTYFYAQGGTLYFATVAKKITAAGENVNLEAITGGVVVNVNNGSANTAKSLDLGYKYSGGTLAFADENLKGCTLKTIVLEKAYGDYGVIAVAAVDIAEATEFTGDFGFQINGVDTNNGHYWKYNSTDKKIELTNITGSLTKTVVKEGDCYTVGIVATEVKDGSNTVFLAEYTEVGGQHVDANDDDKCDLCGMDINELAVSGTNADKWKWSNDSLYMKNMKVGDVYDFEATFVDSPVYLYGNVGIVAAFRADTHLYWMRSDGWMKRSVHDVWTDEELPTSPDETYMAENTTNSDLWTDLAFNTLNGVKTIDGQTLDTVTTANFQDWIAGKNLRIIARVLQDAEKGTYVDVEWRFMDGDMLVLNYHQGFKVTDVSTLSVGINWDTNVNVTKAQYVKATGNRSVIDEISTETVSNVPGHTDYAPSTGVEGTVSGSTITLSGSASALAQVTATATHYIGFKINFSQALDATTQAVVKNAAGTAVDGAYAVWAAADAYDAMVVYIPLKSGETYTTFTIDLSNFSAATLQNDITLDVHDVAVSNVTATLSGADNMGLAADEFTIAYTNIQGTNTLVVNDGTPVALNDIGTDTPTTLKDGLSVKRSAINGNAVTLTFTKAAADLGNVIPAYTINLKDGDSVIANTKIDAPITVNGLSDDGFAVKVNTESGWYAKAVGTTLYLFTDTNVNPGELPVNVNAGYTTLGSDDSGIDLLRGSDLGYTYNNGFSFRLAAAFSPLVAHTTGIYTAVGNKFLAVLKIDLASLKIEANTEYGFAIETEGAKYYAVSADRQITESSAPSNEITLRNASCTQEGVVVHGVETDKTQCKYYGLIERTLGEHSWGTDDESDMKGYNTAKKCSDCGAIKYGQTGVTQSWGLGTDKGWNDGNSWETFATLYKGGYYKITGTTASRGSLVWELNEPGITSVINTSASGFRIDHWVENGGNDVFGLTSGQPGDNEGVTFEAYNNTTSSVVDFGTLADAVTAGLNGAETTYIFDYTNSGVLIIKNTVKNSNVDVTVTWTITNSKILAVETLYLAFHADCSVFTASSVETIVPAGKTAPTALSTHQHQYDSTTHKCECGEIDPQHLSAGHTYDKANPDGTGEGTTYCACGALNPNHNHSYDANHICTLCKSAVDEALIDRSATTDESTSMKGAFGGGDPATFWDTCNSEATSQLTGNFAAKFTFNGGTATMPGAVLEFGFVGLDDATFGNGIWDYNTNDDNNWGGLKETVGTTVVFNDVVKTGEKPTSYADISFKVYVYRVDTTIVWTYQFIKDNAIVYSVTGTLTNCPTSALTIKFVGNTSGMTDFKAWTGTLA